MFDIKKRAPSLQKIGKLSLSKMKNIAALNQPNKQTNAVNPGWMNYFFKLHISIWSTTKSLPFTMTDIAVKL